MSLVGLNILVCDDEMAAELTATVRALGGQAVPAFTLRRARHLVFDSGRVFDAAIIDLLLHNGNGAEFIRELSLTIPELPCVLVSGADLRTIGLEGLDGVVFLPKPFRQDELVQAVAIARDRAKAHAKTDPSDLAPDSEPPTQPG